MDIQKNQTQESFEKLYVKNAPDWSLERDQDGGYKYHATQSAFLLFEQQQVEIDLLKAELAKAQAVPEGFVLVPKLLSDELADELASDAFNNIQSMFDYEHRGSTATHREQIRLRWCKNKAREFQENYKIVIEAQEQKG